MEKEKCVYCEEDKEMFLPMDYANTDFSLNLDHENTISIAYEWDEYSDYAVYRPKYCPECGRKLSDKDD